jgi:hypothetical protein
LPRAASPTVLRIRSLAGGAAYSFRRALSPTPSIDTIQEFKIETNNAKAEHEGPAAISIITRSGTNELHATLFEFNRNRALAAKGFFATGLPKPAFNRNEFGANAGGPMIRNKTFFFGSYEGTRPRTARAPVLTLGTQAMRSGGLSAIGTPVRDPLSGANFPNNQIPSSRLSGQAQRLLEFVPLPNRGGLANNCITTAGDIIDVNRYSAKADHNFNRRNAICAVLSYSKGSPYFVALGTPLNYGNFGDGGYITKSATLGYNRTISPTVLNEAKYSYFNHASIRIGQNTEFNPATILPALYQPLPIGGLPNVSIAGFAGIADSGGSPRAPQITQQLTDNLSSVRVAHTLKVGADIAFRRISTNPGAAGTSFGSFTFNGRYAGNAFADFVTGYPVSTARQTPRIPTTPPSTAAAAIRSVPTSSTPRRPTNCRSVPARTTPTPAARRARSSADGRWRASCSSAPGCRSASGSHRHRRAGTPAAPTR